MLYYYPESQEEMKSYETFKIPYEDSSWEYSQKIMQAQEKGEVILQIPCCDGVVILVRLEDYS